MLQAALNNDDFVDDALLLVATHNKCVVFTAGFNFGGVAQICCGSNTAIFLPPTRIDVKDILQVNLAKFDQFRNELDFIGFFVLFSQSPFVEVNTAVCN